MEMRTGCACRRGQSRCSRSCCWPRWDDWTATSGSKSAAGTAARAAVRDHRPMIDALLLLFMAPCSCSCWASITELGVRLEKLVELTLPRGGLAKPNNIAYTNRTQLTKHSAKP
eukprot:scaffold43039_cov106-Phaeocystis_antarctica.AAC.4